MKNNPNLPPDTVSIFTSFCPVCGPNGSLIVRDKRIGEESVDKMLAQAYANIQTPSTNKQPPTGYSASKPQEPTVNEDFFKKIKKWFGRQ